MNGHDLHVIDRSDEYLLALLPRVSLRAYLPDDGRSEKVPNGDVGDLEMIWRKKPSENAVKDTIEIWEGFETMTLEDWKELLEKIGFIDVQTVDFSDMMQNIEQEMKKELGFKGMMKFACKLMIHGNLRRAWKEYERVFKEHKEYIGYGYFIGRKNGRASGNPAIASLPPLP